MYSLLHQIKYITKNVYPYQTVYNCFAFTNSAIKLNDWQTSLAQLKIGLRLVFEYMGLWGCSWFLTGDLEEGVIFNIIDQVGRWLGKYPESLLKIQHDIVDCLHLGLGGWWRFL